MKQTDYPILGIRFVSLFMICGIDFLQLMGHHKEDYKSV